MPKRTKVIWGEGLLLSPQHLQQQDRYHEQRGSELFQAAVSFAYGLTRLELDRDSIQNGQVVLHGAAGVLPGGSPFSVPDKDEPPSSRNIEEHFAISDASLAVYLGLRVHSPGQLEISPDAGDGSDARYSANTIKVYDETTGQGERDIEVARSNLKLLFPDENLGNYQILQIAEIVRKAESGFTYRANYMPTCLSVSGSDAVMRIVRRVVELLLAKSKELSDRRRFSGKGAAEFGRDDTAGFWLLGTVNSFIPVLSHLLRNPRAHPERVYLTLAQLAGELTTLSDLEVGAIPPYDHDRPEAAFADLSERIPQLLVEILPRNYKKIPLTRRDELVHIGRIEDERDLDPKVALYLGVYANVSTSDLQSSFPESAKIASADKLDFLVAAALKGVGLRLSQTLPQAVPVQPNYVYFQIEKVGDIWESIAGTKTIAIYVPSEYPGIQLELVVVTA